MEIKNKLTERKYHLLHIYLAVFAGSLLGNAMTAVFSSIKIGF